MSEELVLLAVDGPLATITLNRPSKLNALSYEMLGALEAILDQVDRSREVRVAVLTGAGERAFCVGADILDWDSYGPLEKWQRWNRDGHRVFDRLAHLRQPTIAALNGMTFGGGLELALACDLRYAAENTLLALPEATIGTIPGWGGTQRLAEIVGQGRAKQMIFTGGRITAGTAEQWGLLNGIAPAARLMEVVTETARQIAANAPLSVQIAKESLNGGGGVALEALGGALAATTQDAREGVASFREKRPPAYQGK